MKHEEPFSNPSRHEASILWMNRKPDDTLALSCWRSYGTYANKGTLSLVV